MKVSNSVSHVPGGDKAPCMEISSFSRELGMQLAEVDGVPTSGHCFFLRNLWLLLHGAVIYIGVWIDQVCVEEQQFYFMELTVFWIVPHDFIFHKKVGSEQVLLGSDP